jgi:hypothetical protein
MRIICLAIASIIGALSISDASAQLANWSIGTNPAYTDFPINASGQIHGACRISQMKFHATDADKMYTVTGQGGAFETSDGAVNWTVMQGTENLASSCASICVDYTNDQIIYLGTGDANYYSNGQGIYKSTDGGVTFVPSTLTNCLVIEILQDPLYSGTFVAATNKGIYKSTNSGLTWTAQTATTIPFCDMVQEASNNTRTLFAATHENSARLFRSTDYGSTWTQITSGIVTAVGNIQAGARIAVTPADTNVVYYNAIGGLGIIHKSTDDGLNFVVQKPENVQNLTGYSNSIASGGGQGNYNNCFTVDRLNPSKLWYQSHNTWRSSNDGVTWTFLHNWYDEIHTDAHQIIQSPFDPTKLYAANDGAIWLSTDEGDNWTPVSDGLYAFEIGTGAFASSRTSKEELVIGTQDNGKVYRVPSGFKTIGGGDDYERKEFDYLPNGGYFYNMDGTTRKASPATGPNVSYGLPVVVSSIEAIAFNRVNPEVGFVGKYNVFRTTNLSSSSPTWIQISTFSTPIRAIHSCVADINKLYVITSDQKLYVSSNAMSATPTFTSITLPSSVSSVASITAIANNANTVYISINAAVYVSTNSGTTWTNITYNLPNVNHRKILSEEYGGTEELVFIATNNAVYFKKVGQVTWTNYSTNLPGRRSPTGFTMFDNGTNQSVIRYCSYGRGVWETPFDNLRAYSAQIIVNGDTNITCNNPSLQFASGSLGTNNTPISYAWSFPGGSPASSSASTQNVTYTTTGTYNITLTITDALNNVSSKTISKYIQVIACDADTIPGSTLSIAGTTNYASTPTIPLGTTNTITLSAWIKIPGTQPSFAGILFTASGSATGLNFRNGNQIGYHYNGLASTYNYSGGPVIPTNQWVHIALVTTAANSRIYVNGVAYTNNVANTAINFSSGFNLGNDRNNTSRTMTGQMDEVCIYDRALSQNEIRELMHLTKNHLAVDPNLKAYYQCNESGSILYDRAGNANGSLSGAATHVVSSAPVGSGNSERQTITTNGLKTFPNEGINLTFGTGTLPNGEICVTRLNLQPDALPIGATSTNSAASYWIINNYGSNATFTSLTNMTATGFGNITVPEATTPNKFKLYRRITGGFDYPSWSLLDSAASATSGANGSLAFTSANNNAFSRQFTIVKNFAPTNFTVTATAGANGNMTPVGATSLVSGSSITYTISGNPCYQVQNVLVDGVSIGAVTSYTFSNIIANHTISATFTSNYTIVASAGTNGLVTPFGTNTVVCAANQTFNITPNFCNQITDVIVDGASVGPVSSYTFTNVSASHTISATFSPLVPCATDTIPGSALSIGGTTNYAVTSPIALGNTNTVTFSAWIKIETPQTASAGIVFTSSGGACGLNFRSGNQIGYHFDNASGTYNYAGGPIIPQGEWVHVALVTTATNATIYVNGVSYVNNVANAAVDFDGEFFLGNDRNNTSRTMTGMIDEVCIYNRSLTQNEIRELMHLTKNNSTIDADLKAYYQCNETGSNVYDRVANAHGTLLGTCAHAQSTAPVGKGTSQRQTITTNGLKTFSAVGMNLNFGTGTLPDGELCITRINQQPDSIPAGASAINVSSRYWIINNYGTNSSFTALNGINATGFGNISVPEVSQPDAFRIYSRSTGAYLRSPWSSGIQNATSAVAGTNGVLDFTAMTVTSFNKQFTIAKNAAYAISGPSISLCSGGSVVLGAANNPSLSYAWSPSTGLSSTTSSNPTATPSATTTYSLTTTNSVTGLTATSNSTITIIPSTLTATTIASSPVSSSFCDGGSVSLTASGGLSPTIMQLGAGTSVTSGSSTSSTLGPNPIQNFYGGSKQMMLFTGVELNSLGLTSGSVLSGFAVNLSAANTAYVLQNLIVKIQNTTLSTLTSFVNTGWTTVRNSANYTITGVGWNTISFNTNYTWDGISNLLIDISYSNNNAGSSGNTSFFGATSNVSTLLYRVDNVVAATIEAFSGAPTYSYSARNNVRFSLAPSTTTYAWSPSAGLNTSSGTTVVASPAATTNYTVTASATGSCPNTASKTVTLPTHVITASSGANGSISSSGADTLNCGSSKIYTITADACYQIASVLIDGFNNAVAVSTGTFTFSNVSAAHTISATFVVITNNITSSAGANGTISPNGTIAVNCGSNQVYTITPDVGYVIADVIVDGVSQGAVSSFSFTNVNSAHTISATFTSGVSLTWYQDADSDSFGNPLVSLVAGVAPLGFVADNTDCCDTNPDVNPSTEWWADMDGDGVGSFIYQTGCLSGIGCNSNTWTPQTIPYYAPAHGGALYLIDCNDSNVLISPLATEVCGNNIDNNCNGQIDEGCAAIINDVAANATTVQYSSNMNYPNCYVINGTTVGTADSPESIFNGPDVWYKFVAQSSAVSITLTSSTMDDAIALYTKSGNTFNLIDSENVGSGLADFERLNRAGLTLGTTYYVSVGASNNAAGGAFQVCIQHLMPSGCANAIPVGGFSLCWNYKAIFRGAASYTFNFTGTGGNAAMPYATTSSNSTTGFQLLSVPSLNLRHGGIYQTRIDANYSLLNGAGNAENITVLGNVTAPNCTGVLIAPQPLMEVKLTQQCPALIQRSAYLIATPILGNNAACGALNYTFEFTKVVSCSDNSGLSLVTEYTTATSAPYLPLGVLPSGTSIATWNVRVRPNYSFGVGAYGPPAIIKVSGVAGSILQNDVDCFSTTEKNMNHAPTVDYFPNPMHGDVLNIHIEEIESEFVVIRILDNTGRLIFENNYATVGYLNTIIEFEKSLSSQLYMIECIDGQKVIREKLMVVK